MHSPNLRFGSQTLLFGAVVALVAAALLVAYLQRLHGLQQREQNELVRWEMVERTAALLSDRLRQEFEAVFVSTIESIDHEDLREARLSEFAGVLAAGHDRHPFVDRFFFWNQRLPAAASHEALFFDPFPTGENHVVSISAVDGRPLGGLVRDHALGADLLALAHSSEHRGRTLILADRVIGGERHQVVLHTYGASRWPRDSPGIIGYTVNLDTAERRVLPAMVQAELDRMPRRLDSAPRLRFSLLDSLGGLRHGDPPPPDVPAGRASFDLAFFPRAEPAGWFAGADISLPAWTVVVTSDPVHDLSAGLDHIYVAVLGLILMALVCATLVNRQSLRLSRLHADVVGNVTHQLKTPLAVLAAATETLEHERLRSPEKVREYAAFLGQHTASLTRIVERVLRLSQVESGAAAFRFEAVDLAALVRDCVRRFGGGLPRPSLSISFDGPPGTVRVLADASALDDAVTNLLDNAAKYTTGEGRIDVAVVCTGGNAIVRVVDNGVGIERREIKRIFKRFYRGRGQGTLVKGFGVGLAVVDAVVHAHHGKIRVDSEPGRGSRFEIVLPTLVES